MRVEALVAERRSGEAAPAHQAMVRLTGQRDGREIFFLLEGDGGGNYSWEADVAALQEHLEGRGGLHALALVFGDARFAASLEWHCATLGLKGVPPPSDPDEPAVAAGGGGSGVDAGWLRLAGGTLLLAAMVGELWRIRT